MQPITNRYEILFVYEARDCNPNGDPLDENRPRTDPETGEATVSDVRIKRTVRDYFLAQEPDVERRLAAGREVLIRDTLKADGHLCEGKDRAEQFLKEVARDKKGEAKRQALEEAVLSGCIDARLFGATLPLGKNEPSLQLTGATQFAAFNRSLHRVSPTLVQQTAAYAGNAKSNQKSFAERWLLPYALIAAYGVVNEAAARSTRMSAADLDALLAALWRGTADLNTHSKLGHDPLLLVVAEYQPGYRLGALPRRIALADQDREDTALRSTRDFTLDVGELLQGWSAMSRLTGLRVMADARLRCRAGEQVDDFIALARAAGLEPQALEL
ncbi:MULTISPECIES: type I-B CRISPR-associated protein Cas7/Csh2 [unclassified Marichromatium]|uniref:type I-B CRISPR-associated protein Cas7/Csh2 n=1 Tax=unclassified Marichromatium TaxID=2618417 RepID=UPI000F4078CA|nr:type I-B CRISPR-associated protein Cas7/Csh2 [Marichromatium sp. AB32]MBO8085827.1 type I-B CRISPR-associated protein Cas7/Csh2 [Marichromatium sp.]RNE93016.1 type I-B CRISPR-associated protein Cas7/Csh2 [Marichromatium sp. AB32]